MSSCGCHGSTSTGRAVEQAGTIDSSSGCRCGCTAVSAGRCNCCAGAVGREHGFQASHDRGFVVGTLDGDGFAVE